MISCCVRIACTSAYAVAKRCIGDLLSHCYLAERLRLIAFQYVADYICTDIEAGNNEIFCCKPWSEDGCMYVKYLA